MLLPHWFYDCFAIRIKKCIKMWNSSNALKYQTYLSKKHITGSAARSLISTFFPYSLTAGWCFIINQPMCEKKKPRLALCGSADVSVYLWWVRWTRIHLVRCVCKIEIYENRKILRRLSKSRFEIRDIKLHNFSYRNATNCLTKIYIYIYSAERKLISQKKKFTKLCVKKF